MGVPAQISNFNMYRTGAKLMGVTGEVSLPEFTGMTSTISGAGILGELDVANPGQFSQMDLQIPYRNISGEETEMFNPGKAVDLTLRASEQSVVNATSDVSYIGMRVVLRGITKSFNPGTLKIGGEMSSTVTISLTYIMIEHDGTKLVELDKLNEKFIVNGVDVMQQIRSQC